MTEWDKVTFPDSDIIKIMFRHSKLLGHNTSKSERKHYHVEIFVQLSFKLILNSCVSPHNVICLMHIGLMTQALLFDAES